MRFRNLPSRREVLEWAAATAAVAALPGCGPKPTPPPPAGPTYLTGGERSALSALVDAVLPADDTPGASQLGVVDFIDRLLTAFEVEAPYAIFAGGPYSGRAPFPSAQGTLSTRFPPNQFKTFVP